MPPSSPAKRQGAEESEVVEDAEVVEDVEIVDAVGMLPRPNGVEIKEADEDLALHLANHLYPHLTHIDQITDRQEKAWWVLISTQVLRGHEAVKRYVEDFSKVFQPGVEAQVNESLKRSAAEEAEREQREAREKELHKANLLLLAQQGTLEQDRLDLEKDQWAQEKEERKARLKVEIEERTTKLKNRNWREKVGLAMAAIGFVFALVVLLLSLESDQPVAAGSAGAVAVTILGVTLRFLLMDQKQQPPSTNDPPPPASA